MNKKQTGTRHREFNRPDDTDNQPAAANTERELLYYIAAAGGVICRLVPSSTPSSSI